MDCFGANIPSGIFAPFQLMDIYGGKYPVRDICPIPINGYLYNIYFYE